MSEPYRLPNHGNCLEFPVDFDTKTVQAIPIGRMMCGDYIVRIFLTREGIKLVVPKSALGKSILVSPDFEDEIQFAGFSTDKK